MIENMLLKSEEKAIFSLRSLYRKYGYMPYKMSKFEEYELYIRNKDFLVSDRIITFNDTNGRLMALKPDVTLSIIKQGEDAKGIKQKVYYNENVYRVSESTHQYKEIMQTGLECIGDLDFYDIYETVALAAQSLELISDRFVLEISHLGIISAIMDEISEDKMFRKSALTYIGRKNTHDLIRLCNKYSIPEQSTKKLVSLVSIYGSCEKVIPELEKTCVSGKAKQALDELKALASMLTPSEYGNRIIFDFSLVNSTNYYNGIMFKGFIDGICTGVLAGGQYDKMMQRMGRKSKAIGFAVYLDVLEQLNKKDCQQYDVDMLVLYNESTTLSKIEQTVKKYVSLGMSVSAQKAVPPKLRYKKCIDIGKEDTIC